MALEQAGPISMLAIKGFISFDEIIQYYKMIYGKDGYATALNKAVAVLPISDDNYETLMRGKTLDEYITFFDESFGEELPDLAGRWKARMEAAKEEEATEDEMITEEEAEVPEEADELKLEVETGKNNLLQSRRRNNGLFKNLFDSPLYQSSRIRLRSLRLTNRKSSVSIPFVRIRFLLFSRRLRIKA